MTTQKPASFAYAEDFVLESEPAQAARRRAEELGGCVPLGVGAAATLRTLAAAINAKAVIEIGTGAGVSGVWLLEGMPSDGVLTTIDVEPENQRAAKEAFAAAGVPHQRARVITGKASEVLGRMTPGSYDLVYIDADKGSYPDYVERATDLLRPGGVMVLDNMLWHDKVADPAVRDESTRTLRDLGKSLRDDERFTVTMLPVSDGLLVAVKNH